MNPAPPAPAPGRRILLVEDEIMIRMLLEDMLADLGHEVNAGAEALDGGLASACASGKIWWMRVMNGSSVRSMRKGVIAMRLCSIAHMSVPLGIDQRLR